MKLPSWDKCEELVRHAKWQADTGHIGEYTKIILAMDARREELEHELRCIHGELGEFREAHVNGKSAIDKIRFLRNEYIEYAHDTAINLENLRDAVGWAAEQLGDGEVCLNGKWITQADELRRLAAPKAKEGL